MDWFRFFSSLSTNTTLIHLNVSWNDFSKNKMIKEKRASKSNKAIQVSITEKIAMFIAKFIKNNKKLLHVNLENTGLNKSMSKIIIGSIRNSKSLVSIHLSHNPFLYQVNQK